MQLIKRHFLSIFMIVAVVTLIYLLVTHYIPSLPLTGEMGSKVNDTIAEYQAGSYEARLSEIVNDKRAIYVLLASSSILFLILLFLVVRVLSGIDPEYFLNPSKYVITRKDEPKAPVTRGKK